MKEKDFLRIEQLERVVDPYRNLLNSNAKSPRLGWVRAIREALGMSGAQLARRMHISASQSVEDMQKDEQTGAIRLRTLRKIADALDCEVVYALVPRKPIQDLRRDQATLIARQQVSRVSHSMSLEDQAVSGEAKESALRRRVERLLSGNPRKLWE